VKIYAVMTLGRQHLGDYFFLRAEKAFTDRAEAEALIAQLQRTSAGRLVRIDTPQGSAECHLEVVAHEFELEDKETVV